MPNDLELMEIHVSALFTHNAESRIVFVNEPESNEAVTVATAPRLFLGRTREGNSWRFRADLPDALCDELNALCADEPPLEGEFNSPPLHLEKIIHLLEQNAFVEEISSGPAYFFGDYQNSSENPITITENNAEVLQGGFEKLFEELHSWQPFVALIEKKKAVSVCRSVRITSEAHEAGVETLPEFRRKGYAAEVTAEWAQQVEALGAIPLYSTSWKNTASQAVARKLGLKCYGTDFSIA